MSKVETLVDVFEEVLQVPFEERNIKDLDIPIIRTLAYRVQEFYDHFELPEKRQGELRPYLFPRFTTTDSISSDYFGHESHFKNGYFSFDAKAIKPLAAQIKAYLLYSHSLCIPDPLPYLLDYFRFENDNDHMKTRVDAVTYLLREYTSVAKLLRKKLLIPISNEIFGSKLNQSFFLDNEEIGAITRTLEKRPQFSRDNSPPNEMAGTFGIIVKEQWWQKLYTKDKLDLYFPSQ